ncbi:MAG: amidohydrolase family protein, partial [Rhabdochlamydiaceae bacterium]
TRINAMKEAGFDKQCLSISLGTIQSYWLSAETEIFLKRRWNDAVARIVKEHDCFIPIGQIPYKSPEAAIAETERAVNELGFPAVNMEGNWAGRNIESEEWMPFFGLCQKLDIPIMSHPSAYFANDFFNQYNPAAKALEKMPCGGLLGFLLLTQISMAGLIFGGVLDRFPKLKIIWLEADVGWLPGYMEFLDGIYDAYCVYKNIPKGTPGLGFRGKRNIPNLKKKPSQYFKENFYYSINFGTDFQLKELIPMLIYKLGMRDRFMIQTDYDHPEGNLDIVERIDRLKDIDEEAREGITGRNAAKLLKVKWAPSVYANLYK